MGQAYLNTWKAISSREELNKKKDLGYKEYEYSLCVENRVCVILLNPCPILPSVCMV